MPRAAVFPYFLLQPAIPTCLRTCYSWQGTIAAIQTEETRILIENIPLWLTCRARKVMIHLRPMLLHCCEGLSFGLPPTLATNQVLHFTVLLRYYVPFPAAKGLRSGLARCGHADIHSRNDSGGNLSRHFSTMGAGIRILRQSSSLYDSCHIPSGIYKILRRPEYNYFNTSTDARLFLWANPRSLNHRWNCRHMPWKEGTSSEDIPSR
jgi:hypothetical protein